MLPGAEYALQWAGTTALVPAVVCQATFAALCAGIIALTLLPKTTQKHLLDYGARDPKNQALSKSRHAHAPAPAPEPAEPDALERLVAAVVARLQVPHAWFTSFYAFYLAAAVFWAVQWWAWEPQVVTGSSSSNSNDSNNLFGWIVERQYTADLAAAAPRPSMALVQVYACFGLESLQAGRRLYEHLYVMKPSSAKMNAAQFVLGLAYYAIMSVAVWVEGAQAIVDAKQHAASLTVTRETLAKLAVGVPLFAAASVSQYRCHAHLASLVKYSLPDKGLFRHLTSPHYTCEVALYFALSILAAPAGRLVNRTLLWSELFVLVSLGVTAARTKQWYSDKFGADRVAGKWIMIPFVY